MSTIAILVHIAPGHIYPLFSIAGALVGRSHQVVFLGIPDTEEIIRKHGFEFHPIMEDVYPKGWTKEDPAKEMEDDPNETLTIPHIMPMIRNDNIQRVFEKIKPDLFIASHIHLSLESLIISLKTGVPYAIFSVHIMTEAKNLGDMALGQLMELADLPEILEFLMNHGITFNELKDVAKPFENVPLLTLCPKEFELPGIDYPSNIHFIESSIRSQPAEKQFDWSAIPQCAKIIYTSLGSGSANFNKQKKSALYQKLINIMNSPDSKGWHMIITFGNSDDIEIFAPFPPSISHFRWVPQTEILQRASLVISHAGMGTVKECIFYGVPMILCPFTTDQPLNAERVQFHKLGVNLDFDAASQQDIFKTMDHVMNDPGIRTALDKMQKVFQHYESTHPGVKLIEKIIGMSEE